MCLAIPSRIVEIKGGLATADVYGARRQINLMLLPEEAQVGEYVLVHAGFAIQKIDEEAARETLSLIGDMLAQVEQEPAE